MSITKVPLAILKPEVNPEVGELIANLGSNKVAVLHNISEEKSVVIGLATLELIETINLDEGVPLVVLPSAAFDTTNEEIQLSDKAIKVVDEIVNSAGATLEQSDCPLCLLGAHDLFDNDEDSLKALFLLDSFINLPEEKQAAIAAQLEEARRENPLDALIQALEKSLDSTVH